MNPRGATKEALICAVPMHAPQTSSLWSGVGEGSSAGEVECWRRVQPRPFVKACQGVGRNSSHDGQLPKRGLQCPGWMVGGLWVNNRFSLSSAVLWLARGERKKVCKGVKTYCCSHAQMLPRVMNIVKVWIRSVTQHPFLGSAPRLPDCTYLC